MAGPCRLVTGDARSPQAASRDGAAVLPVGAMTSPAPRVLVLANSYLPGYKAGGPIRSIENLVNAFGDEFDFRILTMDRDLGDTRPYPEIATGQWVRVGRAEVMYLSPGWRGFLRAWTVLRAVDSGTVVYLNSFFNSRFSIAPMLMRWLGLCRPQCLLIAPRGEFSSGALQLSPGRKRWYLRLSRLLGLYDHALWQASSDFERADVERQFPATRDIAVAGVVSQDNEPRATSLVVTASDIGVPVSRAPGSRKVKIPGVLRLVFVGRCSPMKNLSGALRMLRGLSGAVSFCIYGPTEDAEYWKECQDLIAALPPNVQVRYEGEVAHEKVAQVFRSHDLFLLPTLGENFGHVICEALAVGCPVLISDQTPWRNLEAEGAGWDIALENVQRFRSVLQQCVDADHEWFTALSRRARNYAADRGSDPYIIEANRSLLTRAFRWQMDNSGVNQ